MKRTIFICLSVLMAQLVFAQEMPPNLKLSPPRQTDNKQVGFELPKSLTLSQLVSILTATRSGYYEVMAVRQAIIARGASIVPLLKEALMADSLMTVASGTGSPGDTTSFGIAAPVDQGIGYVVGFLDAIGTEQSYQALLTAACKHPDPNVRGSAIIALGSSMHDRVCAGTLKPDAEVVHVLMTCLDDPAETTSFQMKVGDLARQSLSTWTGIELGPLDESLKTLNVGKQKQVMAISEYRDYWWKRISPGLTWVESEARFSVPK